jgi:hypothetical protein
MRILACIATLLLPLMPPQGKNKEPDRFAVVVNTKNAVKGDADELRDLVKKLFLKIATQWPGGAEARLYARTADSAEMKAFVEKVLGMSEPELARHWLQMRNRNGVAPPHEVGAGRVVVRYVEKYEEAMAIMTLAEAKESGLRILLTF